MTPSPLENLVTIGKLYAVAPSAAELDELLRKSHLMLRDAAGTALAVESRFALAYGAAHGFALAALWRCGFRSADRFTVFECLLHTTKLSPVPRRVLISAHRIRNQMEYEADNRVSDDFVETVIAATEELAECLRP